MAGPVLGEVIYTRDGRKLQGTILEDDGNTIKLETDTEIIILEQSNIKRMLDDAEAESQPEPDESQPETKPETSAPEPEEDRPAPEAEGKPVETTKPAARGPAGASGPDSAFWKRSLLFPGLGQYEAGATTRGSIYAGAAAFLVYNFFSAYTDFNKAQAAYSSPLIPGLLASTQGPLVNALYMKGQRDRLFAAEARRDFSLQLLALFWGFNVFDAAYLTGGTAARMPARAYVSLQPVFLKRTVERDLLLGLEIPF